jgi:hypothetical protein
MHSFSDSKGRTWNLELNVDVIELVKADCGVNLLDVADPDSDLLKELVAYPPLIAKLIFSALADQAKLREVDAREFRRSMNGDALQAAHDALLDEIILFSPSHRRNLLQAVRDKNREVEEAGTKLALTRLHDPELAHQALAAMDRQISERIKSALETLGATPSSTSAGPPPACSDSPALDLTPTAGSSDSPTGPGSPTATS